MTFSGGEPLLRPDALELVAAAREHCQVHLVTNGSRLEDSVLESLERLEVCQVQLTLLGSSREKHDALKGASSFDETLRAIVSLLELKISTQICFVATQKNWQEFEAVLELAFALGVRSIAYNRMSPAGAAIHEINQLLETVPGMPLRAVLPGRMQGERVRHLRRLAASGAVFRQCLERGGKCVVAVA